MFFMPWPWGLRVFVCGFWGFVLFWFAWPCVWGWVGPGLVFWTVVLTVALAWLHALLCGVGWGLLVLFGEFDPGSGRTLAACLTHASRTGPPLWGWVEWRTGEYHVSNLPPAPG